MPYKRHTETHKGEQGQASRARRASPVVETHYAIETKSGMNDFGYIWVGIFVRKLRAQKKRKPLKPVFPVQAATRFV